MKIKIKVHSGSSREKIEKIEGDSFEIWIKEKPIEGKANDSIEKLLKKYFGMKAKIIKGFRSKKKVVEVEDEI